MQVNFEQKAMFKCLLSVCVYVGVVLFYIIVTVAMSIVQNIPKLVERNIYPLVFATSRKHAYIILTPLNLTFI